MEEPNQPIPLLPMEVILRIVECVIPEDPPVAYTRHDIVTKTLLSFSRTCKATSTLATSLLLQHCLYIDTEHQLELVVQMLQSGNSLLARCGSDLIRDGVGLCLDEPWWDSRLFCQRYPKKGQMPLPDIIEVLFRKLFPHIRRLVIRGTEKLSGTSTDALRKALTQMPNLQEFSSVGYSSYLHCAYSQPWPVSHCDGTHAGGDGDSEIWSFWPQLRRLALCSTQINQRCFTTALKRPQRLTHLVLATPWGLPAFVEQACFRHGSLKLERLTYVNMANGITLSGWEGCSVHRESSLIHTSTRLKLDGNGKICVQQEASTFEPGLHVQRIRMKHSTEQRRSVAEDADTIATHFVLPRALAGDLWGMHGLLVIPKDCQCVDF